MEDFSNKSYEDRIKDIKDTWKNAQSLSDINHFFKKFTKIEI